MKFVVLLAALFFNVLATQAETHMSSTVGGGRSFSGYGIDMEMEMAAARSIDFDMGEAQDRCTAIGVAKLASEVYT